MSILRVFHIITKPGCSYCDNAKALLTTCGLKYTEEVVETPDQIAAFKRLGYKTFPQVFDGISHVGGFDQLTDYLGA